MGPVISRDYNELKQDIVRFLQEGKERAQMLVEQETLRTYHEIGRLLNVHVLAHRDRADYGAQLMVRLAGDVGMSKTLLYQALAFYRFDPSFHARGNLTWTHYRALLGAPGPAAQRFYEEAAVRNGWSVRELDAQVKAGAFAAAQEEQEAGATPGPAQRALPALRGRFYTYRLVDASGDSEAPDLRLDLGFGIHLARPVGGLAGLRPGAFVTVAHSGANGYRFSEAQGRQAAFYSYSARVVQVVDGDTLWLDIDCGFRVWTRQKVRLRGIDAPELPTPEGVRAKDFVRQALRGVPSVAVTTTKPDKYDRYLADVFYLPGADEPETVLRDGIFLNRALLKAGLAVRFSKGAESAEKAQAGEM